MMGRRTVLKVFAGLPFLGLLRLPQPQVFRSAGKFAIPPGTKLVTVEVRGSGGGAGGYSGDRS